MKQHTCKHAIYIYYDVFNGSLFNKSILLICTADFMEFILKLYKLLIEFIKQFFNKCASNRQKNKALLSSVVN